MERKGKKEGANIYEGSRKRRNKTIEPKHASKEERTHKRKEEKCVL